MTQNTPARPLVIGHRGASGYRPEHTEAAYRLAFAQGADAVEPDVVFSRDGVAVVRHENEISGTTDVAAHPEFADRRTTRSVDGEELTGWFTEDFTWAELSTLRARERLPTLRPESASHDDAFPLLRLVDVLRIVDEVAEETGRGVFPVVEVKHASHFDALGLPAAELVARALEESRWAGRGGQTGPTGRLVVESFEQTVLGELRMRGVDARYIYLVEAHGKPFDQVVRWGDAAVGYLDQLTDASLSQLAAEVDGISLDKALILPLDADGNSTRVSDVVARAHGAGLEVYTWTLRPENAFLPRDMRIGRSSSAFGQWQREYRTIMASGVDGVFADHPDLAVVARGGGVGGGA
ncbi:glycerophosphodiester phosphodiesterase family protein [Herbiconiux sp. KACC 21604]|uniref:glycerophosphodiester phosphodiesterase family protein n=1 Tax=unclassified Herbiconiux TaxID=2618217 RepID=UPI0014930774|nr:glycerophosphodiester phosphodiesterase family protein [Herbiconiux sp. SALV-R1]QJU52460.1 glycerophosphodiester phosphodiesterase [Herbiconiux sp. SALV-R1]WPO87331.1 glycerophosphodiester phosphodiesterase family protein [Herbiconiux sp. KACC 21604]